MTAEAELGETIAGYVLEAPLGRGSTSRVFVGRHVTIGRRAAIKVLAVSVMDSEDARRRLLQEARAVADIHHPHIAAIWDFHESSDPPRLALVMELVEGPSMKILRGAPLEPRRARGVALQLVEALEAAHAAGVIHRDLKPDNLLFAEDPRRPEVEPHLVVVDFGLAKRLGPGAMVQTMAGTMLGTPAYMAPEQITGRPAPSPATDVYAVAELVYELFTGERAFNQEVAETLLRLKVRGEVPELALPTPLDQELQSVLRACLDPDPARRPTLAQLTAALEGLGTRALSIPAGATAFGAPPVRSASSLAPGESEWVARKGPRALLELDRATGALPSASARDGEEGAEAPTSELETADARARIAQEDDEDGLRTEIAPDRDAPGFVEVSELDRRPPPSDTDTITRASPVPGADSVLRPLDVRRAMRTGASSPRARVVVDTDGSVAVDAEADTVSPSPVKVTVGASTWVGWLLGAALLAAAGAVVWLTL